MNNQHLFNGIMTFTTPDHEIYLRSAITDRSNLTFTNNVTIDGLELPFVSTHQYSGIYDHFTTGSIVQHDLPEGYFVTSSFSLAEEVLLKSPDDKFVRIVDRSGNHIQLNKKMLAGIYQFYKAFRETGDLFFIETAFNTISHLNGKKLFLDFAAATFPARDALTFITRLEADAYIPFGNKFTHMTHGNLSLKDGVVKSPLQANLNKTTFYYDDARKFTIVARRSATSDDCPLVFLKVRDDSHILLKRERYPDLFEKIDDSIETIGISILKVPNIEYRYMIFKNFHLKQDIKDAITIVVKGVPHYSHVDILRILGNHPSFKK